jgi:hypothetical protein
VVGIPAVEPIKINSFTTKKDPCPKENALEKVLPRTEVFGNLWITQAGETRRFFSLLRMTSEPTYTFSTSSTTANNPSAQALTRQPSAYCLPTVRAEVSAT